MKPIRRAAKCLIIENGKIVITKYLQGRKVGYYDIPGGKIEENESSKQALIREIKEELNADIEKYSRRMTTRKMVELFETLVHKNCTF